MERTKDLPTLALIVPCYNEEQMIPITIKTLQALMHGLVDEHLIASNSFILFVDDGSVDNTLQIIRKTASVHVKALKLSGNVGHQQALIAGLTFVTERCHCAVSLDADLQDDINVVHEMIAHYKQGSHIVYGIREERETDSAFKKHTAQLFYRLMEKMDVNLVYNHADYRLVSNTVLRELNKYKEVNLFLRGIFPKMGFTSTHVYYKRKSRIAGESKYPFRKMIALAINGITSFSNLPLKIITYVGFLVFVVSIALSVWVVAVSMQGKAVPGWASITLPIYFIGGVQLLALGIIGEYIGKIYLETKARPRFHIEEFIEPEDVVVAKSEKEVDWDMYKKVIG